MENYWSEIITFLVTLGSSWGVISTNVKNQEKEIEELLSNLEGGEYDIQGINRLKELLKGV